MAYPYSLRGTTHALEDRMSQISEFFGLQARIVREVDSKNYTSFTSLFVGWLMKNPEIKATNRHLYIHKIIFDITARHYSVIGIENRIASLAISVKVNQKQEDNGAIKFINHKIGHRLTPSIGHIFGDYKNTYFINGNQFTNTHFEEYLAT